MKDFSLISLEQKERVRNLYSLWLVFSWRCGLAVTLTPQKGLYGQVRWKDPVHTVTWHISDWKSCQLQLLYVVCVSYSRNYRTLNSCIYCILNVLYHNSHTKTSISVNWFLMKSQCLNFVCLSCYAKLWKPLSRFNCVCQKELSQT